MCGIVLLHGPEAQRRIAGCLRCLKHRGPDGTAIWSAGPTVIGFNRLAINDKGAAGQQPHHQGDLVGVFNGEIYNDRNLVDRHELQIDGWCDTSVVLPLFESMGTDVIDALDGFYSGLVLDQHTLQLHALRDHMGKKPLLVGRSGTELFITSELKAFLPDIEWFKPLPKGVSRVDLRSGDVEVVRLHGATACRRDLAQLMEEAVTKRLPREDESLGMFLSGGLDSSIVASLVARFRPDTTFYVLADADSPDHRFAKVVIEFLGLDKVRSVPLPRPEELPSLIEKVVWATESYNPSVISNGLSTYLLAEAAHQDGIKVVLTGEGADELFCGYHYLPRNAAWRQLRSRLVEDMHFTELRRLDSCCMAHAVEARCPFLDRNVRAHADGLEYPDFYRSEGGGLQNKIALRAAFAGRIPSQVARRRKTSFDVGSGIRGLVVEHLRRGGRSEKEHLGSVWSQLFGPESTHPYFHSYPVFDDVIATRGASHR